ncbi:MAG: hypothetical protein KAF64_16650, partial [Hydrogenophaga sp.]|uniref:hypothetical protein n=1 Tax=Hydrogenophaga sp. TaxID=1904254 RepID=UPI0025C3D076
KFELEQHALHSGKIRANEWKSQDCRSLHSLLAKVAVEATTLVHQFNWNDGSETPCKMSAPCVESSRLRDNG